MDMSRSIVERISPRQRLETPLGVPEELMAQLRNGGYGVICRRNLCIATSKR